MCVLSSVTEELELQHLKAIHKYKATCLLVCMLEHVSNTFFLVEPLVSKASQPSAEAKMRAYRSQKFYY